MEELTEARQRELAILRFDSALAALLELVSHREREAILSAAVIEHLIVASRDIARERLLVWACTFVLHVRARVASSTEEANTN